MIHEVEGARFAWRECGDGSIVALFHGLGGSRISWEPQLHGLSDEQREVVDAMVQDLRDKGGPEQAPRPEADVRGDGDAADGEAQDGEQADR